AEKQAEEIIANAKKNRLTKLRQAKDKAEEELKDFREKEEARFQKEMGAKAGANPAETLQVSTQSEIDSVHKDYANNKAKTIEYVVGRVLEVPVTLSDTQKQALKTGAA
ncbi:atp6v1g, partial [Symbiodinium sp. CCMP2456]